MSEKPRPVSAVTRIAVAGIGAAVSSILFSPYMIFPPPGLVFGLLVPFPTAGFVFSLLAPFPTMVLRLRYGRGMAVIVTLATTYLLTAEFDTQAGVLYLVQCGMIALLLPELIIRGYGAVRSIAWTTSLNLIIYFLAALAIISISGRSVHQLYDLAVSDINTSITQVLAIYEKTGIIKGDDLVAMKNAKATVSNLIIGIYPALATIMLIVMSGCNLAMIERFSLRLGVELKISQFRDFRNPEWMIWLLIAAGFAMLSDVALVTIPALNILMVLGVLYFLQGMAVLRSMFFRLGSSMVLRVALYLLLFVQPYMAALVAAIGIFDLWGDFRTPRKQENL